MLNLLQRETEGNAFFMVEMVRVLAEHAGSLGEIAQAHRAWRESLTLTHAMKLRSVTLETLFGVVRLRLRDGDMIGSARLAGLIVHHDNVEAQTLQETQAFITTLATLLEAEVLTATLAEGAALSLDATVETVIEELSVVLRNSCCEKSAYNES